MMALLLLPDDLGLGHLFTQWGVLRPQRPETQRHRIHSRAGEGNS